MEKLKTTLNTKQKTASANFKALQIAKARAIDGLLSNSLNLSLEQRYQKRLEQEAKTKQHNLELIMRLTVSFSQDSTGGDPDPDWISAFLEMAENISSSNMQKLWAKILAMEIASPGLFSVKSLRILKSMTHKEAQIFQQACALASTLDDSSAKKIIIGYNRSVSQLELFSSPIHCRLNTGLYRLPYSALLMLSDLGLLHISELESGKLPLSEDLQINYNGEIIKLQAVKAKIRLVYYRFTPIGNELSTLIPHKIIAEYQHSLREHFSPDFRFS